METYTCHVRIPGVEAPHVSLIAGADPIELAGALRELLRQWPDFELIEIRGAEGRLVSSFDARSPPRDGSGP